MDDATRLEAILRRHEAAFYAEHPEREPAIDIVTHEGAPWMRIGFCRDYCRWLRAKGYLTREEFLGFNTYLRQAENAIHNQEQLDT